MTASAATPKYVSRWQQSLLFKYTMPSALYFREEEEDEYFVSLEPALTNTASENVLQKSATSSHN